MSLVSAWLWASGGFIAGWVAQVFWCDRVRLRPYTTPDEYEFVCVDCGRLVHRITNFAPPNVCLDCGEDAFLASVLDPTNEARPRDDYVKSVPK